MVAPLVLFGGAFDPPHHAHLFAAECARVHFGAERVVFLPTGEPYHKKHNDPHAFPAQVAKRRSDPSAAALRVAMLELAVRDNPAFEVDSREVTRAGASYTVDTLEEITRELPGTPLVFVIGSDGLADFWRWKSPERVLEMATIAVVVKPGERREPPLPIPHVEVPMPLLPISSTLVRERVAEGLPVRYLVPNAVADFIEARGLYREGRE